MTQIAGKRLESIDKTAAEPLIGNAAGTYSVSILSEGDRMVTVPELGKARVIAKARPLCWQP